MTAWGFDMPVFGVGAGDEGDPTLVFGSCVGAEDVIAETGACVYAMSVWLGRYASFGGDTEVDILCSQAAAYFGQAAVPAVLDVVGGYGHCGARGWSDACGSGCGLWWRLRA